jgi:geranylgeranyl pyrophosphate synthase
MTDFNFESWSVGYQQRIQFLLEERFQGNQIKNMSEACLYPIKTGGKRFRPLLVYAALEACTSQRQAQALMAYADPCAMAVELVHTYSLVHDDLPCMDDDDFRRGHPTVHRVYPENVAVLVGDALLTEAFGCLATLPNDLLAKSLKLLHSHAGINGMLGGQSVDIGFEGAFKLPSPADNQEEAEHKRNTAKEKLLQLHRLKTGALITVSVLLGAQVAGIQSLDLKALEAFGQAVGLGFQLADDVLDAEEDAHEEGPPSFVKLLGIEETQRMAKDQFAHATRIAKQMKNPTPLIALASFAINRSF